MAVDDRTLSRDTDAGYVVEQLHYASPRGGRVTATLVSPDTVITGPGVVFLHWGFGRRASFFGEAVAYARAGAASLLLDAPGLGDRGGGLPRVSEAAVARAYLSQCVTDVRRGLDLLVERGADPARLAYVGHSLGATVGGPLAGAEPRFAAMALMAGYGDLSRGGWSFKPSESYRLELEPLDGTRFVARAKAALFFQFATRDELVSRDAAERFVAAAAAGSKVAWYDADHRLSAEALRDRALWLNEKLGLHPPQGDWLEGVRLPRRDVVRYLAARPVYRLAARVARSV